MINNYQPADGNTLINVIVTVRDANNASLPNIAVNLVSNSPNALFVADLEQTDERGLFSAGFSDMVAETIEVTAVAEGVRSLPMKLTFMAPTSAIELTTKQQFAQKGESLEVTVLTRQNLLQLGNTTADNTQAVLVPLPNAPIKISLTGAASFSATPPTTTDETGQAAFIISDKQAETIVVTVSSGVVTQTLSLYIGANLTLIPASLTAIETATFTAVLRDGNNIPLAEQTVNFSLAGSSNEILSPNSAVTATDGTVQMTVTDLEKNGGSAIAKATLGSLRAAATVNFLAAFGEDRQLAAKTSASLLKIGDTATITAQIVDKNQLPIVGQRVNFKLLTAEGNLSHARITVENGTSNSLGEVSTEITDTLGENLRVIVQADTATQTIPLYFGATLRILASSTTGIADGTTPLPLTALVNDANGAGITGIPVNYRITQGQALLDKSQVLTDESGKAQVNVTDYSPDNVKVQVMAGQLENATTTLTFLAPGAELRLETMDQFLPVNGSAQITIITTQIVNEIQGGALPNAQLSMTVSGSAKFTESAPLSTDASGKASVILTDEKAETVVVTVSSGSLTQTLTLYFGATLSLLPTSSSVMETATLTALLKDGNEVPIAGEMVTFNFIGPNNKTLTPTSAITTAEGTAQVTVNDVAKDKGEVVIKANAGQLSAQATVTFKDNVIDERVASVKVIISNDFQPADGKSAITVTVIARDAQNVPVSSVPVSLLSPSDTAFFETVSGTTAENGRFSTTVTNSVAEKVSVTATAGGITGAPVTLTFVSGSIDTRVSTVKLTVTNDFQIADGKSPVTLTVIARDAANVPIANVQIYLVSPSDTALLEAVSGKTGENGRFSTTVTDSVAETIEVSATAGGVAAAPVTITFVSSAVDSRVSTLKLTVSDNYQRADGSSKTTLTVIALDSNKLPLAGVVVSLSSNSSSALFAAVTGATDDSGQFSTMMTDSIAETFQVTATAGGKPSDAVNVTFIEAVDSIELVAAATLLPVGGNTTVTVTVYQDIFTSTGGFGGDSLPNALFKVMVSGNAKLSDVPNRVDNSGRAGFTVMDNVPEEVVVTVTSGLVSQTLVLQFGAMLSLIPTTVNAIGSTKLKVLLVNGYNAPLPKQVVNFSFVQFANETFSPSSTVTTEDGTAEVTVTDLGNDGGTTIVKATSGQLEAQAVVNFLTDIGQNRQLQVKTAATLLNTGQLVSVTGSIKDSVGVPVVGQPVNFAMALVNSEPSHAKILETMPSNGLTDANGEVRVMVMDEIGENVVVTVQAGTAAQKVPLYFGANINLVPHESHATANGTTPTTLTASVNDASGGGIAGAIVTFRTTSKTALLDPYQTTTDTLGQAIVKVTNTVSESVTVEARADQLTMATANIDFSFIGSGSPNSIILETVPPEPIILSLNGTAKIIATVLDYQNVPVKDGTAVNFATNGIGTVTETVFTHQGKAEAIFNTGTTAGLARVTVGALGCYPVSSCPSTGISITVLSGEAGIIEVSKVEPKVIGIVGSGVTQSTTIQFAIKDNLGNPVKDGTEVNFSLGKTTLGGGETITTGDEAQFANVAVGKTNNGIVAVTLKSGIVAGTVDVIATVGKVSTVASVTIVGSLPDADHLSLAAKYLNIAGGVQFGLQDEMTAYVADRFGNIVPDGTAVSFITEGGTIGKSIGKEAFTTTTEFGQATAVLQSANPMTPNLGGMPTLRLLGYDCGLYTEVSAGTQRDLCGNPGLSTIVAYTTGSESFIDNNGNGRFEVGVDRFTNPGFIDANGNQRWDLGEVITGKGDLSEPYIDGNDNYTFDSGELYIDVNTNGKFNGPDGVFQSNTTVWESMRILFSANTAPLVVTLTTPISIPNGGSQLFTVPSIGDIYGNALVAGSQFKVTANNGILGGVTEFTLGESNGRGQTALQFTLASKPPQQLTDKDADGNETTRLEYPPATSATITITVTSPFTDQSPGGNGDQTGVITGTINSN